MLKSVGSQRVGRNLATEQQQKVKHRVTRTQDSTPKNLPQRSEGVSTEKLVHEYL